MSWFEKKEIGQQAAHYATKNYVDKEKARAFEDGVKWTLERFWRMLDVHPMEEQAGVKKMCDEFRLKDFKILVRKLAEEREV